MPPPDALTVPGSGDRTPAAIEPVDVPAPSPAPKIEPAPKAEPQPVDPPDYAPYHQAVMEYAAGQKALLGQSIVAGAAADPQHHAKVLALADATHLPSDAVEQNFDEISARVKQGGYAHDIVQQDHPELAQWLTDPDNAKIAQGDVGVLRTLSDAARFAKDPHADVTGILPDGMSFSPNGSIVERTNGKITNAYPTIDSLRQAYQDQVAQEGLARGKADALYQQFGSAAGLVSGFESPYAHMVSTLQRMVGDEADTSAQDYLDIGSHTLNPNLSGDLQRGVGGLFGSLPLLAAGGGVGKAADTLLKLRALAPIARSTLLADRIKAFAVWSPLAVPGAVEAGQKDGVGAGVLNFAENAIVPAAFGTGSPVVKAFLPGTEEAATAAVGGKIRTAVNLLKAGGFQASIGGATALTNAMQAYGLGDKQALDPGNLGQSLAAASILQGVMGVAFAIPHEIGGRMQRQLVQSREAVRWADANAHVAEILTDSETAKLSPGRTIELVDSMLGADAKTFHQTEEWDHEWTAAGEDPAAMAAAMHVEEAYRQAKENPGSTFAAPAAEYLVRASKTTNLKGLMESMREYPNAPNVTEAMVFHKDSSAEMTALRKQLDADVQKRAPAIPETDPIYQHQLHELTNAHGDADAAKHQAQVTAALFHVLAERFTTHGSPINAWDEYQKYNLTVNRETPGALAKPKAAVPELSLSEAQTANLASARRMIEDIRANKTPKDPQQAAEQDQFAKEMLDKGLAGIDAIHGQSADALARQMILDEQTRSTQTEPPSVSFKTERGGSVYTVSGKSTQRTKGASGFQHAGDVGLKESSLETRYVSPEAAGELGVIYTEGTPLHWPEVPGGKMARAHMERVEGGIKLTWYQGRDASGKAIERTKTFPSSDTPTVGSHPVEFMKGSYHIGSKITDIASSDGTTSQTFEQPHQGSMTVERGANGAKRFTMALTNRMGLSTVLHEGGHFYLEVLGDFAQRPDAPPQVQKDYATILKWLGVKDRAGIKAEHHEKFADGFLRYVSEGKAPSEALRGAFYRFGVWMGRIAQSIKNLWPKLDPEVRDVFNRLLATDTEIAHAQEQVGESTLLSRDMFPTDKAWLDYTARAAESGQRAREILAGKLMGARERYKSQVWDETHAQVVKEITPGINRRPVYVAESVLRNGTMPDGSPLPEGQEAIKLDRQNLIDRFGKDAVARLPRGVTAKNGVNAEIAARMFGFETGEDLWKALANMQPRAEVIDAEATAITRERIPDLMTDGTIAEEALASVHNEIRGDVLDQQSVALALKANRRAIPRERLRFLAEQRIGALPGDAIHPSSYTTAEQRYNRQVIERMRQKDYNGAFEANQNELMNHEMFRAATAAREIRSKALDLAVVVKKDSTQKMLNQAGGQVYEVGDKTFENERDASEAAKGGNIRVGDGFLDRANRLAEEIRNTYRTTPHDQLEGMYDELRSIVHMAREQFKVIMEGKQTSLAEATGRLGDQAVASSRGVKSQNASDRLWDPLFRGAASFRAAHLRLTSITRQLDAFKDGGAWWDATNRQLNHSGDNYVTRYAKSVAHMEKLLRAWDKIGFGKPNPFKAVHDPKLDTLQTKGYISHMGRIMAMLNYGTPEGRQRLSNHGWDDRQMQHIIDSLDEKDWAYVKGVWDHIAEFRPEFFAVEERLKGLPPKKREELPIQTKYGEVQGRYFPISYDYNSQVGVAENMALDQAKRTAQISTKRGRAISALQTVNRRLRLDENVISEYIADTLHHITHDDAIENIKKLLNNKELQDTVIRHHGINAYRVIRDTVAVVSSGDVAATSTLEKMARHLRTGVSAAQMGYNVSTGLTQFTGATQSIQRVGLKYWGDAMMQFAGDAAKMESTFKWIASKDPGMLNRWTRGASHRELYDAINTLSFRGLTNPVKAHMYDVMMYMQKMVDGPTWLAAYTKFKDENPLRDGATAEETDVAERKAVDVASQTVIDTQGSGQLKDLAMVQRGSEFAKIFTTFYHFFGTTFGLTDEAIVSQNYRGKATTRQEGGGTVTTYAGPAQAIGNLAVSYLLLYGIPVALSRLMYDAEHGSGKAGNDPHYWLKQLSKDHLTYLMNTMVGVRELTGAIDGFDYQGPAGLRGMAALSGLIQQVQQGVADKGLWHAGMTVGGILGHYPSTQLTRIIDGYMDMQENHTSPARILFGAAKK